jgi:ABC-type transport system involved in cytochrome bd biosynthesis fused ATPase/permease subunit
VRPIHLVRYGLPVLIAVAGIITIVAGTGSVAVAAGVALIGVAVLVIIINFLARLTVSSQDEREREARARDEFSRTGRWPPR